VRRYSGYITAIILQKGERTELVVDSTGMFLAGEN